MASLKQPSVFLLLTLFTITSIINSSKAIDCPDRGAISVYWGQAPKGIEAEGTLLEACDSGNYNIVILESLIVFDDGRTPKLNLADHCGTSSRPCTELEPQIEHCQNKGIQVFLSIGEDLRQGKASHRNSIGSSDGDGVAKELANYLWRNFLSGQPGPLGNVALDGIDIADVQGGENLHWDELVKAINASTTERKIYLSASPQCVYPDQLLNPAIQTGLLDYIWVEFYNPNPSCIYSEGSAENLLRAWTKWTSEVPDSFIFLGLAASRNVVGHIEPDVLKVEVLPTAKQARNYGGVMIWDRTSDRENNYSGQIKDGVGKKCICVCDGVPASASFYGLGPRSLPL